LYRERVDEPEPERQADQNDERPEQLAPGRMLAVSSGSYVRAVRDLVAGDPALFRSV
jgi:hypothetical protein